MSKVTELVTAAAIALADQLAAAGWTAADVERATAPDLTEATLRAVATVLRDRERHPEPFAGLAS